MSSSNNMNERTGEEIFRFDKPNDVLCGTLRVIDHIPINGKQTLRYVVENDEDGKLHATLGTTDLNRKLRASDVGKLVEIRFEGTEENPTKGKHPIKRFKVLVRD